MAILGLTATSCRTSEFAQEHAQAMLFVISRNGEAFVLRQPGQLNECLDAVASEKIAHQLDLLLSGTREKTVAVNIVKDETTEIHPPTISLIDDKPGISSSAWIERGGRQIFLRCSVDELYKIVGSR